MKLTDTTFEDNTAIGRGGAVNVSGNRDQAQGHPCRGARRTRPASAAALFTQADSTIKESIFDSEHGRRCRCVLVGSGRRHLLQLGEPAGAEHDADRRDERHEQPGHRRRQPAGRRHLDDRDRPPAPQLDDRLERRAPCRRAWRRRLRRPERERAGPPTGSALIEFTTFSENEAGAGAIEGDAIFASLPDNEISIRTSIIDEGTDGVRRRAPEPTSSPAATTSKTSSTPTAGSTRRPTRTSNDLPDRPVAERQPAGRHAAAQAS